jgi:hypothetical protein
MVERVVHHGQGFQEEGKGQGKGREMMGWNTVAVIYNDHIRDANRSLVRMDQAIIHSSLGQNATDAGMRFGFGKIISTAHADYDQVVIVGQNSGSKADLETDLSWCAADQMIRCLEQNGYRVTKRRKAKRETQ